MRISYIIWVKSRRVLWISIVWPPKFIQQNEGRQTSTVLVKSVSEGQEVWGDVFRWNPTLCWEENISFRQKTLRPWAHFAFPLMNPIIIVTSVRTLLRWNIFQMKIRGTGILFWTPSSGTHGPSSFWTTVITPEHEGINNSQFCL